MGPIIEWSKYNILLDLRLHMPSWTSDLQGKMSWNAHRKTWAKIRNPQESNRPRNREDIQGTHKRHNRGWAQTAGSEIFPWIENRMTTNKTCKRIITLKHGPGPLEGKPAKWYWACSVCGLVYITRGCAIFCCDTQKRPYYLKTIMKPRLDAIGRIVDGQFIRFTKSRN